MGSNSLSNTFFEDISASFSGDWIEIDFSGKGFFVGFFASLFEDDFLILSLFPTTRFSSVSDLMISLVVCFDWILEVESLICFIKFSFFESNLISAVSVMFTWEFNGDFGVLFCLSILLSSISESLEWITGFTWMSCDEFFEHLFLLN